jgi:hypothetical protein
VLSAFRNGRLFTAIDALAAPRRFEFTASSGNDVARAGERLVAKGPVVVRVAADLPRRGAITLIRDGSVVAEVAAPELRFEAGPAPAVYRAEISMPSAPGSPPVPWIVSNPIYVGPAKGESRAVVRPAASISQALRADEPAVRAENHAESRATLEQSAAGQLMLDYGLAGGPPGGQYAAMALRVPQQHFDRLSFVARSDRPMRLSVQLRSGGTSSERWQRSVYLDETNRAYTLFVDDMRPAGRTSTFQANEVSSVLFVVDTVNTLPGSSGRIWLQDIRIER